MEPMVMTDALPVQSQPERRDIKTRITPETARLYHQMRREKLAKRENEPARQPEQRIEPNLLSSRITLLRIELHRLDVLAGALTDPLDIERMARARGSIAEQIRIASGIPLPGNLRPVAKRSRSQDASVEPL